MDLKKLSAAILSCVLTCCAIHAAEHMLRPYPASALQQAAGTTDNPFNKQNDAEVPYDGTRWVQPPEWNCPTIRPRDYQGGIMLYCDKIGLEPEYVRGKVQRVYFSIIGAEVPVSMMKFHLYYDTRLKVKENAAGEVMNAGKAVAGFTTGSAMPEEGQLSFYAYSPDDITLPNGSLFTVDFIIPENAEPGDLYPIGLAYTDDGIVCDTFINSAKDEAGKLQMTYVFTKGIYNGYLKMAGEKPAAAAPLKGDADESGDVSAEDVQLALKAYTERIAGNDPGLSDRALQAADVNDDGTLSVDDVQNILIYYVSNTVAGKHLTWEEILDPDAR